MNPPILPFVPGLCLRGSDPRQPSFQDKAFSALEMTGPGHSSALSDPWENEETEK